MNRIHDPNEFEPACIQRHLGLWAIEARAIRSAIAAIRDGRPLWSAEDARREGSKSGPLLYYLTDDNVAIVPMFGAISKGDSKFGGVNSLRTRRAIRAAVADQDVAGIMLHIDSPGGMVAGTDDLARDVEQAGRAKPVVSHIDDLGASGAYWVASQTSRITSNRLGQIGSIGCVLIVEDASKKMEDEGVAVHVISTGEFKGMGAYGSEITEAMLAKWQEGVDEINDVFMQTIKSGRGMSIADVRALATGEVWFAPEAAENGLIDGVASFEDAYGMLLQDIADQAPPRSVRRSSRASLQLAEVAAKLSSSRRNNSK